MVRHNNTGVGVTTSEDYVAASLPIDDESNTQEHPDKFLTG